MLRFLRYGIFAVLVLSGLAVAFLQHDLRLVGFGMAALGYILFLVYAPLLGMIGLVLVLTRRVPRTRVVARAQMVMTSVVLFGVTALSVSSYATFLFSRFFNMYSVPTLAAESLLIKLAWVVSVACAPWAHIADVEVSHQPMTVHVELIVAALMTGCAVIAAAVTYQQQAVSWQIMATVFAVTMSIGFLSLARRVVSLRARLAETA